MLGMIEQAERFVKAVEDAQNKRTFSLNLSGLCVGDAELEEVIPIFEDNPKIELLDLHNNIITDKGANDLCALLTQRSTSLKKLYLHKNDFGDLGVVLLANALRLNSTIEVLSFDGTSVGLQEMANSLSHWNVTLKELGISVGNSFYQLPTQESDFSRAKLPFPLDTEVLTTICGSLRRNISLSISVAKTTQQSLAQRPRTTPPSGASVLQQFEAALGSAEAAFQEFEEDFRARRAYWEEERRLYKETRRLYSSPAWLRRNVSLGNLKQLTQKLQEETVRRPKRKHTRGQTVA